MMINLSLPSLILFLMSTMPSAYSQGFCSDSAGTNVGPSGPLLVSNETTKKVTIERKGGEACGCSHAKAKCTIDGKPCAGYVVNGTEATMNGIAAYPTITMAYTLKICNFNDNTMGFASIVNNLHRSYLKFWSTTPGSISKNYIENKVYDNLKNPTMLGTKVCQKATSTIQMSTTTSNFYMEALVQGKLQTSKPGAFCYAYAFNPIEFVYDYGDPPCDMTTEAYCVVADGDWAGTSCADYIDSMTDANYHNFTGTYSFQACNMNDREVFLQQGPSNRKYNIYERNSKGKYVRKKDTLPSSIKGLGSAKGSNCYEPKAVTKIIDPTEKNFFQINVEGSVYNSQNIKHFRDKECKSFKFVELPIIDPSAPSASPTTSPTSSVEPSAGPSVSQAPSSAPSTSVSPSSSPSNSMKPSTTPSRSVSPSARPSISQAPSSAPSTSAAPSSSKGKGGKGKPKTPKTPKKERKRLRRLRA